MRISDAKPGDVLRDTDGGLWQRQGSGVVFFGLLGSIEWSDDEIDGVECEFGPFTRLVPEQEPTDAP